MVIASGSHPRAEETNSGRYYARAVRTTDCKAANSVTLRAQQ